MKRKIIAAVFTGMLTVALFPAIAHAEIENPEDYMGIWYANYVIYSDESSERHNVAEYLNQYLEMRLMEVLTWKCPTIVRSQTRQKF